MFLPAGAPHGDGGDGREPHAHGQEGMGAGPGGLWRAGTTGGKGTDANEDAIGRRAQRALGRRHYIAVRGTILSGS